MALTSGSIALASPSQARPLPAARALAGSHPSWATARADLGTAAATAQFTGTVYLQGRDQAGLHAYADSVSDPSSSAYRKFLSPARFQARFGVRASELAAVQRWLSGAGLTVVSATRHAVTVRGDNAAIARAFGTTIHQYKIGGRTAHAPSGTLSVPAAVAGTVLGLTGFSSDLGAHAEPDSVRTRDTGAGSKPADGLPQVSTCSDYWGEKTATGAPAGYVSTAVPFTQCSFVPSQLRKAYGITATGLTGKGATVAVVDVYGSPTMLADANTFATNHGDQAFRPGQYTEVMDPSKWSHQDVCGSPAGWASEESLDVEMVHGLAPDANVVYVGGNDCTDAGLLAALSTIVDDRLADVVSNSWSEIMHSVWGDIDPATIQAYEQVFLQGAVEGIGFDFSSGDCGDQSPRAALTGANCQTAAARAQVDFPSSDPYVTDVGGTALGLADKSGTYGFETDMGTLRSSLISNGTAWYPLPGRFFFGGGGGTSEDFAQPWYQKGVVPSSLAHTLVTGAPSQTAQRVTPDVAMNGDLYTSVLVGETAGGVYGEFGVGGTSVSAPEFSAVQADAIQAQGGLPIGFANPEIYLRSRLGLFHDVVNNTAATGQAPLSNVADFGVINGTLRVRLAAYGRDTSLVATLGYDDATGVGTPTAAYLRSFLWVGWLFGARG